MAGGWLPLNRPEDLEPLQRMLTGRLLAMLGKDPERLAPIRLSEPQPAGGGSVSGGNPQPPLG
jgi:hypothetical protein